jgi:hypothetical protein
MIIADGFWYVDAKTGERKWQTGDMLMARLRSDREKQRELRTKQWEAIEEAFKAAAERLREKDEEIAFLHNRLLLAEEKLGLPMRRCDDDADRAEVLEAARQARERQNKAADDGASKLRAVG